MGYCSDVRIRLTKKDYERLVEEFENKILPKTQFNLFKLNYMIRNELKDYGFWVQKDENGNYIEKVADCVFFGWNGLKWYYSNEDVEFIMNFIQNCDQYAYCRIGESLEGDVETRSKNMEMIGFYHAFDEEV